MGHKAADCEHNGKCRECSEAGHLARACPSCRGGRAWGDGTILANATPADAQSFPPLVAPAEADVPETTEPMCSMDAEDSHVLSGSPSVPEAESSPGTSGVSLLAAVDGMDGSDSDNDRYR